jgi:hypothetical protein
MAIYHLSATVVQRSRGHSAIAAAAYRAGEMLRDRYLQLTHDYTRKGGVVQSEILAPHYAPEWVHNRQELWNQAEFAEKRRDGQPAREIRVALPSELTDEERADLVFNFCHEAFVKRGMIADVSIHRPDRHGDQRNHHAHILLTMRELDGDHFATRKQRDWNKEETLQDWREMWADYQNRALAEAGYDARVDHRTLDAQGIDRNPTTHLGKAATAMERRKQQTERGDQKREVEARNQRVDWLKEELSAVETLIEVEQILAEAQQEPHEEPLALTWEEEKAAAQSVFDDPLIEKQSSMAQKPAEDEVQLPLLTWKEQKAKAQSALHDPTIEKYRSTAQQPAKDEAPLSPLTWEEQKAADQSAFRDPLIEKQGSTERQSAKGEAQPSLLTWEEQKAAAQSAFQDSLAKKYRHDIQEKGEVQEYGLGQNWYDRTVAFFENIYYNTAEYLKSGFQKHVGRHLFPAQDIEQDMDR